MVTVGYPHFLKCTNISRCTILKVHLPGAEMAGTQELTVAVEDVLSAVSRVARAVMKIYIIRMQICQFGMQVCL